MILVKLFVDDKDYDTNDGYELICTDWQIGTAVELAVRNGFKDIRISDPSALEVINYRKVVNQDDI